MASNTTYLADYGANKLHVVETDTEAIAYTNRIPWGPLTERLWTKTLDDWREFLAYLQSERMCRFEVVE